MQNPFGTNPRDQVAAHEAGHAVVGTLVYGPGFVRKIRMKEKAQGYAETQTNIDTMGHCPKMIWDGNALIDVMDADGELENLAFTMLAVAGMAAEAITFKKFTPADHDLSAIKQILERDGLPALDLDDPDLGKKLFNTPPYSDGLSYAKQLLERNLPKFDAVYTWLKKTDTLQGHEVEALMAGKTIREPE